MRTHHYNLLTVSKHYICGNFTYETLNLHARESTLEKIVPQCLIRNTEYGRGRCILASVIKTIFFINVPYHNLVASLTLMALFTEPS